MKGFRYRLINRNSETIFCNLANNEIKNISTVDSISQKLSGNVRAGTITGDIGCVIAFSTDRNYIKSSQKFKSSIEVVFNTLGVLENVIDQSILENNQNTNRLIHNLTSLNGHNIQEIYSLIPQENVSKKYGKQIPYVENIVKNEPRETAITLLRIAKNNAAMKAEFSVFRKLFDKNPNLQKRNHNVHKVLMNILYLFFPDFIDKKVKVNIGESKETAFFDYEALHVAFYHLIDNAAKYIKVNTELNVEFKGEVNSVLIIMSMVSTEIRNNERDKIFEEGVSGEIPVQLGKAGEGIGLSLVKRIVELSGGSVEVIPTSEQKEVIIGVTYQKNIFVIKLPRK